MTAIAQPCSKNSTATRVPSRPAAVKSPVITPFRQPTGKNRAKIRRADSALGSPIQLPAIRGVRTQSPPATGRAKRRQYPMQPHRAGRTLRRRPRASAER